MARNHATRRGIAYTGINRRQAWVFTYLTELGASMFTAGWAMN